MVVVNSNCVIRCLSRRGDLSRSPGLAWVCRHAQTPEFTLMTLGPVAWEFDQKAAAPPDAITLAYRRCFRGERELTTMLDSGSSRRCSGAGWGDDLPEDQTCSNHGPKPSMSSLPTSLKGRSATCSVCQRLAHNYLWAHPAGHLRILWWVCQKCAPSNSKVGASTRAYRNTASGKRHQSQQRAALDRLCLTEFRHRTHFVLDNALMWCFIGHSSRSRILLKCFSTAVAPTSFSLCMANLLAVTGNEARRNGRWGSI